MLFLSFHVSMLAVDRNHLDILVREWPRSLETVASQGEGSAVCA